MPSTVKVRINAARNLPPMQTRNGPVKLSTDAYVTVTLGGHSEFISDYEDITTFSQNTTTAPKRKCYRDKTKVFRIVKTLKPDVYDLYLSNNGDLIKKGNALIQNISLSHKLLSYFEKNDPSNEIKVKCEYNQDFKKWKPICLTNEKISNE